MDLVKITWNDSMDLKGTWASTEEVKDFAKELCTIESVGWVVKKTKAYITICGDFSPDPDTHGRVTKVPRKTVVKIELLGEVEGRPSPIPSSETPTAPPHAT